MVAFCCATTPAIGAPGAAAAWRALTRIDADAAYRLLKDNHPAAVPEAGDPKFVSALEAAHAQALRRAAAVTTIEGYAATMSEFANSMADGHIQSYLRFAPRSVEWAGIIAAKRGADWVVATDDPKITGVELMGARITGCDGTSVADLARNVLRYRTVVSVEAFQVLFAGSLLIDNGNPFLKRPAACTFEQDGREQRQALHWTRIGFTKLSETYSKQAYGEAGFGLRPVGSGYWIAIEELAPAAQPVIDAVKTAAEQIRAAPFAVIDLRGNSGGNDNYGRLLAEAIYGRAYVESILGPNADAAPCAEVYRASPQNIQAYARGAEQFRRDGDMAGAAAYERALVAMKAAAAKHERLTGAPACTPKPAPAASGDAQSLMHAPLIVLTDAACFSSCINVVDWFRRLGATQVGQITGADTHYFEVREITLPSGLSLFSTLTAIAPDAPPEIGPYIPDMPYSGDIADTAALEQWIPAKVLR
jgi:hypothetical protein